MVSSRCLLIRFVCTLAKFAATLTSRKVAGDTQMRWTDESSDGTKPDKNLRKLSEAGREGQSAQLETLRSDLWLFPLLHTRQLDWLPQLRGGRQHLRLSRGLITSNIYRNLGNTMIPTHTLGAAAGLTKAGKARDVQPVVTFGKAAASCAQQGRIYGACILAQYETVEKGMCDKEFAEFKSCVQSKVSHHVP